MGCDIHIVVERKHKQTGKWVGLYSTDRWIGARPSIAQRDYEFFAEIAGVRGSSSANRYPRNIPEDVSDLAWQEYMKAPTDHHSASHMSPADFCEIHHRVNPDKSRVEQALYDLLGIDSDQDEEHRVVFWFDN